MKSISDEGRTAPRRSNAPLPEPLNRMLRESSNPKDTTGHGHHEGTIRSNPDRSGGFTANPVRRTVQSWLESSGDRGTVIDAFLADQTPGASEADGILALVLIDGHGHFVIHARQGRARPGAESQTRISALKTCRDFAMVKGAGQGIGEVQRRWGQALGWNSSSDMSTELALLRGRMAGFPGPDDEDDLDALPSPGSPQAL